MRVYRIDGEIEGILKNLGWVRTEAQARKAVNKIIKVSDTAENVFYEPEDIPGNKGGLVSWLNSWIDT